MSTGDLTIGVLLGHLRAALEQARELALGKSYRGMKSNEFGTAMQLPARAFPPLLAAFRDHLAKLDPDSARAMEDEVTELVARIDAAGGFPTRTTPAEKADFGLGFHTWRHEANHGSVDPEPVTAMSAALVRQPARERLAALSLIPPVVEAATEDAVSELRSEGVTWDDIGRIMGMSRQAAHERFGP